MCLPRFLIFILPLQLVILFSPSHCSLIGVWQDWGGSYTLPFTITEVDSATARPTGKVLYTNETLQALFGGQTAFDRKNNIWYMQSIGNGGAIIIALKLDLPKVEFLFSVPLPYEEFVIALDDSKDRIIIAGTNPVVSTAFKRKLDSREPITPLVGDPLDFAVEVGYIDLTTKTYHSITKLPTNHFFLTIAGSSSVLDTSTRLLVVFAQNAMATPTTFYIDTVNIDTGEVKSYPQKDFIVESMIQLPDHTIYAILSNNSQSSYLGTGTVSSSDGVVTYKKSWIDYKSLSFVVNGISVLQPGSNTLYTIISNGVNPPAALVSLDVTTDLPTSVRYFQSNAQYTQPLFFNYI